MSSCCSPKRKEGSEVIRSGKIIAGFGETALSLLFPRRCPVCDRPVRPFRALICPECEETFVRVSGPVCLRCGKPVSPGREYCGDCGRRGHHYDRGCSVFRYRSMSASMYRFKYEGRQEYAAWYGREMGRRLREVMSQPGEGAFPCPEALVPVPLSPARMRARGYNQAALLARAVSRETGIPVREDLLYRDVESAAMRLMDAAARQNNLKRTFHAYGNSVNLKSVMLIDDIYTTGATADACALQLRRAGIRNVTFMTLAIGEDSLCSARTEYEP